MTNFCLEYFWSPWILEIDAVWKKKMLSRFLTKFEKYDLWSADIFFLKFVTSKITIFFFTLSLYCYCKTATIWCRIWCLKSIDRGMITVCSMWFLKSTIGCLKFKYICKSVFVHRQQRNITFCTIICFERERERKFFFYRYNLIFFRNPC